MSHGTLFCVENLKKSYSGKAVVNQLSFSIARGEVVGLLGPNGAGKTTAFYMATGLVAPDSGAIWFQGREITHLPIHKRAKMGLGYLAQEPSVFPSLTVEDNLLCILEMLPLCKKERMEKLEESLKELHLTPIRKSRAQSLSGGERRRLEISRALLTNPLLLLLDEPFANIDPLAIQEVQRLIRHLKEKGISILITDHNAREIFAIVDRSYLIQEGRALLSGTVQELVSDPEARRCYFGENFRL